MRAGSLRLRNFRSYRALDLILPEGISILVGENAQGKTNILEAIRYASLTRSHRTSHDAELIRLGEEAANLRLSFYRLGVKNTAELQLSRSHRRRILLNGAPTTPRALVGKLTTVLFSPEDLYLVKGAPALRRSFLDAELCQASPAYFHALSTYSRLLLQRNRLLKEIRDGEAGEDTLGLWDAQLATAAAAIVSRREQAVSHLGELATKMQEDISGARDRLTLSYELHAPEGFAPPMTDDLLSWYNEALAYRRRLDILRGSTSVGPHRDDLRLALGAEDLRAYGSQGQQRTGALSLKLSELSFLAGETGEYPVLLLDDVMSELDASRRLSLLAFLTRESIQTIITATDKAYFEGATDCNYFRVHDSVVE